MYCVRQEAMKFVFFICFNLIILKSTLTDNPREQSPNCRLSLTKDSPHTWWRLYSRNQLRAFSDQRCSHVNTPVLSADPTHTWWQLYPRAFPFIQDPTPDRSTHFCFNACCSNWETQSVISNKLNTFRLHIPLVSNVRAVSNQRYSVHVPTLVDRTRPSTVVSTCHYVRPFQLARPSARPAQVDRAR